MTDSAGTTQITVLLEALEWCIQNKIKLIHMSLGTINYLIKNIELEDLESSVEYYYSGQRVLGKELQRIECYLKRLEKMKDIGK